MTANGRQTAQAVALMAILPEGVHAPQFQLVAQWHTGTGILCLPQRVQVQALPPEVVVQLFIGLVNEGLVHQVLREEGKDPVLAPLPGCEIAFGRPEPSQETPSVGTEHLEKKEGGGHAPD